MRCLASLRQRERAWRTETATESPSACQRRRAAFAGARHGPTSPVLPWLSLALVLALVFLSGCNRNKNRQIPPQATVPSITVPPTAQAGQPRAAGSDHPAAGHERGDGSDSAALASQTKAKPKPQKNSARKTAPAAAKQPRQRKQAQPAPPLRRNLPRPAAAKDKYRLPRRCRKARRRIRNNCCKPPRETCAKSPASSRTANRQCCGRLAPILPSPVPRPRTATWNAPTIWR